MERLAKYISSRNFCSRREAERLISSHIVRVNGTTIDTPVYFVHEEDIVTVGDVALPKRVPECRLWIYHKPVGLITTHNDPQRRKTVFSQIKLPDYDGHLLSVGRLDINTSGLLLLVNNGALANKLTLPASGIVRQYNVTVNRDVSTIKRGPHTIQDKNGLIYRIKGMQSLSENTLSITLEEGKNREVRNIASLIGLKVLKLTRIAYGPFSLGNLKPGKIKEIKKEDVEKLMDQLTTSLLKN